MAISCAKSPPNCRSALSATSEHEVECAKYDRAQVDAWAPKLPDYNVWPDRLAEYDTFVADDDAGATVAWISTSGEGYIDMLFR